MGRPKGSKNKVSEKFIGGMAVVADEPIKPIQSNVPSAINGSEKPPEEGAYRKDGRWYASDHTELCLECNHRSDRHHVWDYFKRQEIHRNYLTGKFMEVTVEDKTPNYNRERHCQHNCKCMAYK